MRARADASAPRGADLPPRGDDFAAGGADAAPRGTARVRNFVYMVECADGTLYTGWTNNLERRIAAHNAGSGAKYTRPRRPVRLVYSRTFDTKQEAMAEEARIKRLTRDQKLKIIEAAALMRNLP